MMTGVDTRTARDLAERYAEPRPSWPQHFRLIRIGGDGGTRFNRGLPIEGVDLVTKPEEHDGTDVVLTVRFGGRSSEGMHGMSTITVTDDTPVEFYVTALGGR